MKDLTAKSKSKSSPLLDRILRKDHLHYEVGIPLPKVVDNLRSLRRDITGPYDYQQWSVQIPDVDDTTDDVDFKIQARRRYRYSTGERRILANSVMFRGSIHRESDNRTSIYFHRQISRFILVFLAVFPILICATLLSVLIGANAWIGWTFMSAGTLFLGGLTYGDMLVDRVEVVEQIEKVLRVHEFQNQKPELVETV